jgi:hypothetical protein
MTAEEVADLVRAGLREFGLEPEPQSRYSANHIIIGAWVLVIQDPVHLIYYSSRAEDVIRGTVRKTGTIDLHDPDSFDDLVRLISRKAWAKVARKRTRKAKKRESTQKAALPSQS